jgi:hypothetical protein
MFGVFTLLTAHADTARYFVDRGEFRAAFGEFGDLDGPPHPSKVAASFQSAPARAIPF